MAGQPVDRPIDQEADFLQIRGWDHIEFWVGNAKQAAYYYQHAWGFTPVAYSGLEMGNRDYASWVLQQGNLRLVLSTPYHPTSTMSAHILLHGDGVHAIALQVDDARAAFEATTSRGAQPALPPTEFRDDFGVIRLSAIKIYGDTVHTFIDRSDYNGAFLPRYRAIPNADPKLSNAGLAAIDHVVGNVELGKMDYWVRFYHDVMGFRQLVHYDDKDISTEYSALMSKVMQNGNGRIKFPLNEPAEGRKKSQIEEYLDFYHGPGVQHIAMATGDIVSTVRGLMSRGVEFLPPPPGAYYEEAPKRLSQFGISIKEDLETLAKYGILIDGDDEGYLLQIFSKPIQDRPTLFFEVIERHGARGFGKGNFEALFEAIEREQALRGNL
jgi:4-hydroxyphenylpyruvate dioxygenase